MTYLPNILILSFPQDLLFDFRNLLLDKYHGWVISIRATATALFAFQL